MDSAAFTLRRAGDEDVADIIRLIDDAARWLRGQGTGQWAEPWPNAVERERRIRRGIELSRERGEDGYAQAVTWLVADGDRPIATTFVTRVPNPALWTADELKVRAVYLHRLVIDRRYAGTRLGERLVQWAGEWGRLAWGAEVMRIDVWTDNIRLHEYYRGRGFLYTDAPHRQADGTFRPDPRLPMHVYPSGVVLDRPLKPVERWPDVLGFRPAADSAPAAPAG
ncbi:GNAT family N-acetyltransferase [Actinomadura logoneensis]|uniref:GNAT family N-acetyltransferase n=1 Tax=Actinomadura logoneensis TaxID=2293572 RepID=A0A372JS38_9ACTN|nr:GNAT family N-acetyltransferase [Actinomadura logoneensis]RFU42853.1 GNAT family N-acetyltransferase [Actinomadura logoneensis]